MTSTDKGRAKWSRGSSSRQKSPSHRRTYVGSSAVVGAVTSAVVVSCILPTQLRPGPTTVMFAPSGLLFLSGIIDLTISLVIIGASIALARIALVARRLARRGGPRRRAGAAALGGALAGVGLSILLPPESVFDVHSVRIHLLAEVSCLVAGGLLGSAYEAVFQFRERRAAGLSRGGDTSEG